MGARWIGDGLDRAQLLKRLRERQQRLAQVRSGSAHYSRNDLNDMLKTSDMRPQYYRRLLLENLSKGKDLIVPREHWAANIIESAAE